MSAYIYTAYLFGCFTAVTAENRGWFYGAQGTSFDGACGRRALVSIGSSSAVGTRLSHWFSCHSSSDCLVHELVKERAEGGSVIFKERV